VGLATGVPVEFLTVAPDYFSQALLDTTTYLASMPNPPSVMTTSYDDDEDNFSLSDAQFVLVSKAHISSNHRLSTEASALVTWHLELAASR
jgi:hypothetical protein